MSIHIYIYIYIQGGFQKLNTLGGNRLGRQNLNRNKERCPAWACWSKSGRQGLFGHTAAIFCRSSDASHSMAFSFSYTSKASKLRFRELNPMVVSAAYWSHWSRLSLPRATRSSNHFACTRKFACIGQFVSVNSVPYLLAWT